MTDKPGLDAFIFGTMRLDQIPPDAAQDILGHCLRSGIRRFHSSTEYSSFPLFGTALKAACADTGVDPKSLRHTVKLASPHFDETDISESRIRALLAEYCDALGTDTIHQVQWMARIDLKREDLRLDLMESRGDALRTVADTLKAEKRITEFGCFPYTLEFAQRAIASGAFDCMIDYFNPNETMPLSYADALREAGMSLVALRPFAAGAGFEGGKSVADLIGFAAGFDGLDGMIAGTGSVPHLDEILQAL